MATDMDTLRQGNPHSQEEMMQWQLRKWFHFVAVKGEQWWVC